MAQVDANAATDLEAHLRQVENDLEQLQLAYEVRGRRLIEERERLVAELEEEHELRAGYREAITQSQQQAALAEAKAEDHRHTAMNREEQVVAWQGRVAALEAQDGLREARVAELEALVAELEGQRYELQRHLDAVFQSKTMRLLRPLRAVYQRVRGRGTA